MSWLTQLRNRPSPYHSKGGGTKEQEDALGINRCLFCDSNDTFELLAGEGGLRITFNACRVHEPLASNVLVNMCGNSATVRASFEENEDRCDHQNMQDDDPVVMANGLASITPRRCVDCGLTTAQQVPWAPNDPDVVARLGATLSAWLETMDPPSDALG